MRNNLNTTNIRQQIEQDILLGTLIDDERLLLVQEHQQFQDPRQPRYNNN